MENERKAIGLSLLTAMEQEKKTKDEVGAILDICDTHLSFLKSKPWVIPNKVWDKIVRWHTSGLDLETFGKIHRGSIKPPELKKAEHPVTLPEAIPAYNHPVIAKAVLERIAVESIPRSEFRELFGFHPNYIGWLKKEETYKKIPEHAWKKMYEWFQKDEKPDEVEKAEQPATPDEATPFPYGNQDFEVTVRDDILLDLDEPKDKEISTLGELIAKETGLFDQLIYRASDKTFVRIHPDDIKAFVELARSILTDIKVTISINQPKS